MLVAAAVQCKIGSIWKDKKKNRYSISSPFGLFLLWTLDWLRFGSDHYLFLSFPFFPKIRVL
jgi:hypothetical protein